MAAEGTRRIGFVSTRLAGTDGVSLETRKWSDVLTGLGHDCFCLAGESDWPADRRHVVPEAHFQHPEVRELNTSLFGTNIRSPETSQGIQRFKEHLKTHLRRFVRSFDLDLLIVENALAIPVHVPLGLALTELIAEVGIPTIGHHHDFAWERGRFWPNAAADYFGSSFPPILPSVRHVVINSIAAEQLALRKGANSTLIPNVMDFESPPPERDDYAADLRSILEIKPDEALLLQPTRVVPRKGIEHTIELARRLSPPCTVVISHASGDEGTAYEAYLRDYADLMGVRVSFAADLFNHYRGQTPDGRKIYALADAYEEANVIAYPSIVEGFGNAFLEAIYYRRPIVVKEYDVFRIDIQPKGFGVIAFDDFITADTVRQAEAVLDDPALTKPMVDRNYELGRRHYSYGVLETRLTSLLDERGWL
ncbi:MAG: glycosyltransferase family 4 protein [Anaerolineae bacterium]|jgi:glycosyltransferase involved in cell wall biosynthesis